MAVTILLTGASGFIGSYLLNALTSDYEVWTLSCSTHFPGASSVNNIQVDLTDTNAISLLKKTLPKFPFDVVLHLASRTPRLGDNTLDNLLAVNCIGVKNLLEGLPVPPRHFAYFSTVDVFGLPSKNSVLNENSPVSPKTEYALSKFMGECITNIWCDAHHVSWSVFRLTQVYGLGDRTGKVISRFCKSVKLGEVPMITGNGQSKRQFINIHDVVRAVMAWLNNPNKVSGYRYILAGNEKISIYNLARLIMQLAGQTGDPYIPSVGNVEQVDYCFDTLETERHLNWRATTSLRSGLLELLSES